MNSHEHWRVAHKRHKIQKNHILLYLRANRVSISLPCTILLTRVSAGKLDDDNLPPAFKWIRDAIADYITPGLRPGRADDNAKITWRYSQEKGLRGKPSIRIDILH